MTPKWLQHLKRTQKNEQTSPRVGSLAAGILSDPKSTPAQKSVAGSALTQRPDRFRPIIRKSTFAKTMDALKKPQ